MMGISWSGPFDEPDNAPDARIHGHLRSDDGKRDIVEDVWKAWQLWAEKLAELSKAQRTADVPN
jgi:hypothetical protein